MPMALRLVVLMHLSYLGSFKKMIEKTRAKRIAENTRLAGICVCAVAERSSEEWQRVGCLLCHNVEIYCPIVFTRTTECSSFRVQ